jgi:hypothetical protein
MYVNDKNFNHPKAVNAAMENLITAIAKEYSHLGYGINRQWIADAYTEFYKGQMDKFIENITASMCGRLHLNNPKGAILIIYRVYPSGAKVISGYAKHNSFEDALKIATLNENLTYNREYTIIDFDKDEIYNHNQIKEMLARYVVIKRKYEQFSYKIESEERREFNHLDAAHKEFDEWIKDVDQTEVERILDVRPYCNVLRAIHFDMSDGADYEFLVTRKE